MPHKRIPLRLAATVSVALIGFRGRADDATTIDVSGALAHVSVHGKVLDPEGRPCPKARVAMRIADTKENKHRFGLFDPGDVLTAVSADDAGRFVINDAPIDATLADIIEKLDRGQRSFDIVAMADGCALGWTAIYGFPSGDETNVALQPAAVLEGRVENDEGTGLDGALVKVLSIAPLGNGEIWGTGENLSVEKPSHLRLVYSTIAPTAIADANGRFRIENLPADRYVSLWACHRDHPQSYFVAAVGPHAKPQPLVERFANAVRETPVQVNPVKLTLRRGPRLRVRVLDQNGSPARGGRVSLFAHMGGLKWQEDVLPADGLLAWAALATGFYRIIYVPPAGECAFSLNQAVSLGNSEFETPKEVRMVLPAGRKLSGRVVGEETEKGLAGVTVVWSSTKVDGDWSDAASSKTITDGDGRFQVRALPGKGRIKLLGNVPGFFIDSRHRRAGEEPGEYRYPVDVPEDGPIAPLVLEVPRGLTVRGKVTDAAGASVPGIAVAAARDMSIRTYSARTVTNANGSFEISGLNPRVDYQLSAIVDDRAGFTIVAGEPRQPWNGSRSVETAIKLEPTVTLSGRVLLSGDPLAGVRLKLQRHHAFKEFNGAPLGDNRSRPRAFTSLMTELQAVVTDTEGLYRFGGFMAGDSYSIEVEPPFPAADASWPHQTPHIPKLPETARGEVKLPDMNLRRLNQSLAGVVVDPDGKPVAGAHVSAMLRNGYTSVSRLSRSGPRPWTETDVDGRFRLEQLPDEPLSLVAYLQRRGGGRIRFPARVSVEMNQQDVRIVLDPSLVEEEE